MSLTDADAIQFTFLEVPDTFASPGGTEEDVLALIEGTTLVAAANSGYTTGMLALVPSEADVKRLAVEDGEAPEQLHLTLVFLGEMAGISEEARAAILAIAERYATAPVSAEAFSVNAFNPSPDSGKDTCIVLGVGNGDESLADLRSNLLSSLNGVPGLQLAPQHTPWVPHVTLAYTDDLARVAEFAEKTGPITFDRLRVAFGDEVHDIPLGEDEVLISAARAGDIMLALASDRGLRNYWTRGAGAAKIRWGTDGSFDRCVRLLGKHVTRPQGLCAEYHKEATGEWPAEKGIPSAGRILTAAADGDAKTPYGDVKYADPGYQADGVKRYPIDTEEHIRAAWAYINKPENAAKYSPGDLRRVRRRIMAAMEKIGADVNAVLTSAAKPCPDGEHRMADGSCMPDEQMPDAYGPSDMVTWEGVLAIEGGESGDGRLFTLNSLDWDQVPLPLMYQYTNSGGHKESILAGQITNVARKKNVIYGWGGVFKSILDGQYGMDVRNMLPTGGVSVDVDKVKDADVEYVYADNDTGLMAKPEITIFNKGRIRGATLVAFPAFVEASLKFTGETIPALTASALPATDCGCPGIPQVDILVAGATHTITLSDLPPKEWFERPTDVKMHGALTVTDEGRVFGRLAPSGVIHRSDAKKRTVPMRTVDYSNWMNKETIVAGGERIVTGVITMNCGHAETDPYYYGTLENRKEHYDNSCSIAANVRIGEDADGVWVAGALRYGMSAEQVATMMGCTLSGDWQPSRNRPGMTEFIAALLVPVPGFPMARSQASVQYQEGALVASAVPVMHASQLDTTISPAIAAFKVAQRAIMESIGLDPATEKAAILADLGLEA